MEPCSNGTPRFNPNPSTPDGSVVTDSGVGEAGASDAARSDGGPTVSVRGTVGEAIAMPRTRMMDTRVASGWTVQSLLDPTRTTTSSATGTFALDVVYDSAGVAPIRAETLTPPRQCAIGHGRSGSADVAVVAFEQSRLQELLAPSGIGIDIGKAQLIVEVEDSLRARVSNVSVTITPATVEGVVYDVENTRFALGMATSTQGTALLTNIDFMGPTAKVDLVLRRDGRMRAIPIYFARGCTTFVTALAP